MRRTKTLVLSSLATAVVFVLSPAASSAVSRAGGQQDGLPNVDRRAADAAAVAARTSSARRSLERELGAGADVRTDRASGAVAYVGRPTGLLTGPSSEDPRTIALDYVRGHDDVFGLTKDDVANLVLVARDVSPDGITHLRFNQVLDGVQSFDSGLDAHVTKDGRLINVSGSPVPRASLTGTSPDLSAGEGLGAARQATHAAGLPPRRTTVKPGASRVTTFASGEQAQLRWSPSADGPVLVWQVIADGGDGHLYDVLVDAADGALVRRQDLTQHLGQARYFRRDPLATPLATTITMPPAWYDDDSAGARLWGQFARTYVDPNDEDPAAGSEAGGTRVQIPASSGAPDWNFTQSTFGAATPCPITGCTWDSATPATYTTNELQAAANLHVLVSRYHDYLAAAPIGFDEASGNFQRTNAGGQGLGGDYIRAEADDGVTKSPTPTFNKADTDMATPPDGQSPRLQVSLWTTFDVNGSDDASVVYHEYGHGLSNRLVVTASGSSALIPLQAGQMGEAWSDFYANDLLNAEGTLPDTPAPAEIRTGSYVAGPGGIRAKPEDCPVNPAGVTGCNGAFGPAVLGGYTYGDLALTDNSSPHNGGEIWAETLWDIRTAVGRLPALALITGGMRLSVDNPSMLDMRDAILQQAIAQRSGAGAADDYYDELWAVFAARGMGASASTPSAGSTTPTEAYDAPAGLRARSTSFRDPYPGGDNDGVVEAGERILVDQSIEGIGIVDLPGVTGTLTTTDSALGIEDASAAWPVLGRGRRAVNADELAVRVPASCATASPITVNVTSTEGAATASAVVDPRRASSTVVPLVDLGAVTATFNVPSGGSITDVDVRIDDLRHTNPGDLTIQLEHDSVTGVLFSNLAGGNYGGDNIVDAVFDSDAGAALPSSNGPGPLTGRYRTSPANALDVFDGHPAAGTWTLRITDASGGNTGELRKWGLDSPEVPCGRAEIPAAATGDASAIGTSSATLGGTVTPNGRATALRFSYGPTPAYGASTTSQDVGTGDGAVGGSAVIGGLAPSTTYHYRVEAIREGGAVAVTGADRTFTTAAPAVAPPPPPPPPPPSAGPDTVAPKLGKVTVKLGKATKRGRKRPSFAFTLSEPASVKLTLTRPAAGRLKGKRCVKPTPKLAKNKRCTRQVPVSTTTRSLTKAGASTIALAASGVAKGKYLATLVATDSAKNASVPAKVSFTVR